MCCARGVDVVRLPQPTLFRHPPLGGGATLPAAVAESRRKSMSRLLPLEGCRPAEVWLTVPLRARQNTTRSLQVCAAEVLRP